MSRFSTINKHKILNIILLFFFIVYFLTDKPFRFNILYPIRYFNMNYLDNLAGKIKRWDWYIDEKKITDLKKINPDAYQWLPQERPLWIAHRMGPGYMLDNTLASLHNGYQLGARIFEVDLVLTENNEIYCYHPTQKEEKKCDSFHSIFNSQLVLQHYEKIGEPVCKFDDLIQFVKTHNDSYFVLDVKTDFAKSYARIHALLHHDKKLLAKFIPQIYWWNNLKTLEQHPGFAGPIFTGYQTGFTTDEIIEFSRKIGIKTITLDTRRVSFYQKHLPDDLVILMHGFWNMNDNISDGHTKGIDGYYFNNALPLFWNKVFETKN